MKIKSVTLKNFRSYRDIRIDFNDMTVLVGRNDIGKSTILEALDIFFNDNRGVIKLDKNDINICAKENGLDTLSIGVEFCDLPDKVILDECAETTFAEEYMLNSNGCLEIIKSYTNAGKAQVSIIANHPVAIEKHDSLLTLKNAELKKLIEKHSIECENLSSNPCMRKAIWRTFSSSYALEEREIGLNSTDGKKIADQLLKILPLYSLFQSDRSNNDSNSEVQDPLKISVASLIQDENIQSILDGIATKVIERLNSVANETVEKLNELDPKISEALKPVIPNTSDLKWADVFKNVSIYGGDDIPINKKGSGVKRMVLLSFFRAKAEKEAAEQNTNGIIYAIEEPETSQHGHYQALLVDSLRQISLNGAQVLLTTHSAHIVKRIDLKDVRLIYSEGGEKLVSRVKQDILPNTTYNEVNYIAFNEITSDYHDELYSYIERNEWVDDMKKCLPPCEYIRIKKNGDTANELIPFPSKVRHMIHHPENKHNGVLTPEMISTSIETMRQFIFQMMSANAE